MFAKVMKKCLIFFAICLPLLLTAQEKGALEVACIGFYNLENLFDTIDDPDIDDSEFLPSGDKKWNTAHYFTKMDHLAEVISKLGTEYSPQGVSVLGVSEVENRTVVEDLVKRPAIAGRHYGIVHFDSPDHRGIDVALLYNPTAFKVRNTATYSVYFKDAPDYHTRDQLVVSGELYGDKVSFIVAHWPSRRGGQKRSAPRREEAARVGRHIVDSLMTADPKARIIYLGDLNDDPVNKSVTDVMNAVGKLNKMDDKTMFNPMKPLFQNGIGTLAWHDVWNLFDQMLLSPAMAKDEGGWHFYKAAVFNKPMVRQQEGNYAGYPFRTYVGSQWLGGYSDHFAVYLALVRKK